MQITLNGQTCELAEPQTVASLLLWAGLADGRIAVEVNREIVPRGRHGSQSIADGDRVEIIRAIGGG